MESPGAFKVVIAGGGVAALEGLLALRARLGGAVAVELVAPDDEFAYRQLATGEPFSAAEATRFGLSELVEAGGGVHRRDRVASVDARARTVTTATGTELSYDALLIAVGGSPTVALPGALTYRGFETNAEVRAALLELDRSEIESIAYVLPVGVQWGLPLYELALLSAWHLEEIGDSGRDLQLVTHEPEPLAVFGRAASEMVRELLSAAGVELHCGVAPAAVRDESISLMDGSSISASRVIALPRLQVPAFPGVAQGPNGFIDTDAEMRVGGEERIFAAGDATWFPVKQGGIAAQQADVAAGVIASLVDPNAEPTSFTPVLRAALLTGQGPRYLRAQIGGEEIVSGSSRAPLWWPPAKLAAPLLTPFLSARAAGSSETSTPLTDLEPPEDDGEDSAAADHADAVEMCLLSAESDARCREWSGALRWLAVAEQLAITLPAEYQVKREKWQQTARETRIP